MEFDYSIKVYKQYFNFACSHFLIFDNGTREPLHGHNYRVQVKGEAPKLTKDLVFDFLDIKPIVRRLCNELDHRLILPTENPYLKITENGKNYLLECRDDSTFSIPKKDVLLLPLSNTSAERLAIYLCHELRKAISKEFQFSFALLEIEVEETPGQSAIFQHKESNFL